MDFLTWPAGTEMIFSDYHVAAGIALIAVGVVLVCGALIARRRAQTDPSEPDDSGELRSFIDSLRRTEEATTEEYARPRIDRIHNEDPSKIR